MPHLAQTFGSFAFSALWMRPMLFGFLLVRFIVKSLYTNAHSRNTAEKSPETHTKEGENSKQLPVARLELFAYFHLPGHPITSH